MLLGGFYDYYGDCSILEAELRVIDMGFQLCLKHGVKKVWIESDSKVALTLIKQDNGPWEYNIYYNPLDGKWRKWNVK